MLGRRTRAQTDDRNRLGRSGERVAEKLLRRAGLIVLARNWRGGGGELDRVFLDGNTLVFVEVKTRSASTDDPRHPVAVSQRRRIGQAARAFRRRYGVPDLRARFDLVTVSADGARGTDAAEWHRDYQRMTELQEH